MQFVSTNGAHPMINHPPLSPANATQSAPAVEPIAEPVIHSFKGFDRDLKCRGHQFEVGKTYELAGRIHCCNHGWHACENPLDIFGHYPPGESRYAEVTQSGDIDRAESDTKLASAKITIGVEIHIHELIQKAVAWIISKAKPADCQHADGDRSAASSTGYQSAASSTGYQSAASSTGDRSAASSTGYQSAASSKIGRAHV